ncbi:hypothetical protein JOC54_000183 [Alkalihalobacillus xiaoxiensis]|uniref:Uncharacterized protein n=1 Tax=Shouchella xiaoxiensis TaxID=766895 RepID=A0ABS2SRR5_9BACI|nr:hypothetical protein [Shouchella xiaoxiensis]MBM7836952.1 hypothetical protein [Shouchella xiaoxiensis]
MKKYLFALIAITLLAVTPISTEMHADLNDNSILETKSKTDYG